jgi:hypothetical protein
MNRRIATAAVRVPQNTFFGIVLAAGGKDELSRSCHQYKPAKVPLAGRLDAQQADQEHRQQRSLRDRQNADDAFEAALD